MSVHAARLLKAAAIASLIAIIVLSWLPGSERPHTGANTQFEHFAAYLIAALLNLLAFVPPRAIRAILAGMAILAAICEVGQNFVPGRVPQFVDFLAGTTGSLAAVALFTILRRRGLTPRLADKRR